MIGPSAGPNVTELQSANGTCELGSGSGTGVPVGWLVTAGAVCVLAPDEAAPDVLELPHAAIPAALKAARRRLPNFTIGMVGDYLSPRLMCGARWSGL